MFAKIKKQKQLQREKHSHLQVFDLEVMLIHLSQKYNIQQLESLLNAVIDNNQTLLVNGRSFKREGNKYKLF